MSFGQFVYRLHAIRRMFERGISGTDIEIVVHSGEVIEDYPADTPYPSKLLLGWCGSRPVML